VHRPRLRALPVLVLAYGCNVGKDDTVNLRAKDSLFKSSCYIIEILSCATSEGISLDDEAQMNKGFVRASMTRVEVSKVPRYHWQCCWLGRVRTAQHCPQRHDAILDSSIIPKAQLEGNYRVSIRDLFRKRR
jgi:hypothetical protein